MDFPLPISRLNPSTVAIAGVAKTIASSSSNLRKNPDQKAKLTKGRRKIEIRKIENRIKKHVTFSKRRKGLFKKASELCAMCGVSVAVVTFSDTGKAFSFGHPSPDAVFHRYLYGGGSISSSSLREAIASAPDIKRENAGDPFSAGVGVDDRNLPWWDQPIEELGLDELEAFAGSLAQMRGNVESRIADLDFERSKAAIGVKNDIDEHYLIQAGMVPHFPGLPPLDIDRQYQQYQYKNDTDGSRIADLDIERSMAATGVRNDIVEHHLIQAGMTGEMNNNYFVSPHQYHQQYQYGNGCGGVDDDDDIGKIVAANFNRFSGGFGEF